MKKTLAVMQVMTLCQCGGSFHCLPKYMAEGRNKHYHGALHTLEEAVDKIAIITTALTEPGIAVDTVSVCCVCTGIHFSVSAGMSAADRLVPPHA